MASSWILCFSYHNDAQSNKHQITFDVKISERENGASLLRAPQKGEMQEQSRHGEYKCITLTMRDNKIY